MLTVEQNDFMTRVGPEAPAGKLLRRYWQPVALTDELEGKRPVTWHLAALKTAACAAHFTVGCLT